MVGAEFFGNMWSKKSIRIKNAKESDILRCTEPVKGNFYISSYACPYCGDPMFKTIFPIGREYNIKVRSQGTVKMKRVFTCFRCFAFYSATRDKLSDGVVYEYKTDDFWEHDDYVCDMEIHGTTQARPD